MSYLAKFHQILATLSWKQIYAIGIPGGASLGALIDHLFERDWASTGLAGLFGAAIFAVAMAGPRIMEQHTKAKVARAQIEQETADKTVDRMDTVLKRQADFFKEQIEEKDRQLKQKDAIAAFYRTVAAERDLIATEERNAKHDVLNEYGVAAMLLVDNPNFHYKTYTEMVGEHDKAVKDSKDRLRKLAWPINLPEVIHS